MLTVEDYCKIRIAHRDGMSIREMARKFHHSRGKIREMLEESEPRPYTLQEDRPAPRLGPYKGLIEQIVAVDEQAPRKQRHTAAKLYRRLRDEHGYRGGYDQVRRYVGKLVRDRRETFIPLTHPPGRRLEADFGHIYVDFPEGRQQVSVLLLTWSYSGFRFAVALPSEQTEAILAGMVQGFAFFGCVPLILWFRVALVFRNIFADIHTYRLFALRPKRRIIPRFSRRQVYTKVPDLPPLSLCCIALLPPAWLCIRFVARLSSPPNS